MKLNFILILLFNLLLFDQKQSVEADIDLYKNKIDKKRKKELLTEKKYHNMSYLGGAVAGYYEKEKLVLIQTCYNGEIGYHSFDFYIRNDSLLFVTEVEKSYKEFETEESRINYEKRHTDKNGRVDMSRMSTITTVDNYFYINDSTITDSHVKGYRQSKILNAEELAEKNKIIIEHYRLHLSELK